MRCKTCGNTLHKSTENCPGCGRSTGTGITVALIRFVAIIGGGAWIVYEIGRLGGG